MLCAVAVVAKRLLPPPCRSAPRVRAGCGDWVAARAVQERFISKRSSGGNDTTLAIQRSATQPGWLTIEKRAPGACSRSGSFAIGVLVGGGEQQQDENDEPARVRNDREE